MNRCAVFVKVGIERTVADVAKLSIAGLDAEIKSADGYLTIQPDREYRRLMATVDLKLASKILNVSGGCDASNQLCFDDIRSKLHTLNAVTETAVRYHLKAAASNIIHNVWDRFINTDGERAPAVSCNSPLMNRYVLPFNFMLMTHTQSCNGLFSRTT